MQISPLDVGLRVVLSRVDKCPKEHHEAHENDGKQDFADRQAAISFPENAVFIAQCFEMHRDFI